MILGLKTRNEQENGLKYRSEITELPIDKIRPSPYQARKKFDEVELRILSESIKESGLLQPISVVRSGFEYTLIAGERRLRACKLAQMARIPAIIYETAPQDTAKLSYIENSMRSELSPFEQAEAIRHFLLNFGCTQAEAAEHLHMSQSAIANKLRLLNLTRHQRQICMEHKLTERHARAVLRLNSEATRTQFLETIVVKGLNVQDTEKMVEKYLSTPILQKKKSVPVVRDVRLFINTINRAVDIMKNSGIDAMATQSQDDNFIQYTIKIPIQKKHGNI